MLCDNCDRISYCKFVEKYREKSQHNNDELKCNLFAEKGNLARMTHKSEEQIEKARKGKR